MASLTDTRTATNCCIALAIGAVLGCAGRHGIDHHDSASPQGVSPSAAGASEPQVRPLRSLDGPPCSSHGPMIQMSPAPTFHAKPPLRLATTDAHIRNPLGTPIWLLYDLGGSSLPRAVEDLTLSRSTVTPPAYVWAFSGEGGFRGLRIPPGADLSVRGLELSSWSYDEPLLVAFASAVQVADRAAESWIGQAGMLEPRGTFALNDLVTQAERHWDTFGAATLAVSVVCVARANPDAPPSAH
jgi:hypothetical protein